MKTLFIAFLLAGCAVQPEVSNPYQTRAGELVAAYNARHGTSIPVPPVRVGSLKDLQEGNAYCPIHSKGCWLTINEAWDNERHGPGYAMSNTLPHEVAHHICVYLGCPRGDYHGPEWRSIALELGLDPNDSFVKP